jgi:hypothetical protein
MKQSMKILNQKILDSGGTKKMMLVIFYFSFFVVEIFVWYNLIDGSINLPTKFGVTIVLMISIAIAKQKFITQVIINERGAQNISTELAIFPVSRKEILWSHFKSVLATQAILTVLLVALFLLMKKALIWLDLAWVVLLFVIPILIVVICDRKLLKRE